jgi:hypothetical protein
MTENENEINTQSNAPTGDINYSQNDPLEAIGYAAEPGDIYYMNPPKQLSTYPMYIDNPKKVDKTVGSYIAYTMDGTDVTEQLTRRYSDFFALYEKLLQRWPGIYIPRIPPKKMTGNQDPSLIKTRMRLLNRFCLNLSNIEYLYKAEETNIFRNNIPEVANAINKLPELNYTDMLNRMKEAFPEFNENYDIIVGKSKITEFDIFLKKCQKNIEEFQNSVNAASEKREIEKKQYLEMIHGFSNYEKDNMISYADSNETSLIFYNPQYSTLSEKVLKLKQEMINPFIAFKNWLEEETLDVEAMQIAIKQINQLLEEQDKLKERLINLEEEIKKGQAGQVGFFKTLFKKKEDIIAETEKDKENTEQKIKDLDMIIKIVGDNMENQIEVFKNDKTQNYYKYLKMFAILQRESNKVVRELWTLVKNALNDISPNAGQDEEYQAQPMMNQPPQQNNMEISQEKQEPQEENTQENYQENTPENYQENTQENYQENPDNGEAPEE